MRNDPRRNGRRKRHGSSGQTLILAIMILVVILAAVMIFFNVHNAIRAKVKSQDAVDSAALAGANWQMHTLNLIGELNLVKAAEVMISADALGISADPNTFMHQKQPAALTSPQLLQEDLERAEAEKKKLRAALDLVTEMQTRISFVGPLIGFGAAQQAAKNNGISANRESGKLIYDFFYRNVLDDAIYGNEDFVPQIINGYSWRKPYASMIGTLLDASENGKNVNGIAAFPRFSALSMMDTTAEGSPFAAFLTNRAFYDAVIGNNWCAVMNFLDKTVERDMTGTWWGKFQCSYESGFMNQSEILPVHIDFFESDDPGYQTEAPVRKMLEDRKVRPLDAGYDKTDPYPHEVSDTGAVTYTGTFDYWGRPVRDSNDSDLKLSLPEIKWAVFDDEWSAYSDEKKKQWEQFLSGSFRPGMDFSGALSYFEAGLSMSSFKGAGMAAGAFRGLGGSGAIGKQMKRYSNSASRAGDQLKNTTTSIVTSSSAKPLGVIRTDSGTELPPFAAGGLVLPVFTHSVLIPISLDPPEGLSMLDVAWLYYLTEFVPLLAESSTLEDAWAQAMEQYPRHLHYFWRYYDALRKINDPDFRQAGLDWLDAIAIWGKDDEDNPYPVYTNREHHCYGLGAEPKIIGEGGGGGGGRPQPQLRPGDKKGPSILH